MVAGDGSRTIVVVVDGDVELAVWSVDGPAPPDLSVVDAVARLQLAARRAGWSTRLRDPSVALRCLLDLVGLADVLAGASGLPLEDDGQAEGREQLGVQEVVEPADPSP